MIAKKMLFIHLCTSIGLLPHTINSSWAKVVPSTNVHVTLLGRPCILEGPFDEPTLKIIHSIGPAQIYPKLEPPFKNANSDLKKAIEKIRSSQKLPPFLDRYREKLLRRLEAQNAFFEALLFFQKDAHSHLLFTLGAKFLQGKNAKNYENLVKKAQSGGQDGIKNSDPPIEEQLFDSFNDGIEPDPEEEFHRAIKKLDIQYKCSFEDVDDLDSHPKRLQQVRNPPLDSPDQIL